MEVNILLVIVGGIIAIGAIVGFAKGAVRIAVSLGATILTLAVVYFATPYVSKAIYSLTPIDEMVEQQCIKTMTKAFTGEADTNSGFTEEQVRGILSAAGVSEQTLEAAGITVEDIVNGNVSDEMLQQYGISPDIFDGHVSTEEAEQSIMEAARFLFTSNTSNRSFILYQSLLLSSAIYAVIILATQDSISSITSLRSRSTLPCSI